MGVHTWFYYPCTKQPTDTELIESAFDGLHKCMRHVVGILESGAYAKSTKDAYGCYKTREGAEQYLMSVLERINVLLRLRDDDSDDNVFNYEWICWEYDSVNKVEWNYFKKFDAKLFSFPYNYTDLFRYRMVDDVVFLCTYEEAFNFIMTHDVEVYKGLTFSEMLSELRKFFELHPNGEIMIG